MKNFKAIVAAAALAFGFAGSATAQRETLDYPHMFVGLQGGIQNTLNKEFNNCKTITPTASISFGSFFTPVVGARFHVNGIWNKSGVDHSINIDDTHYRYNYITPSADALVNLCTLFGKKEAYPVNLIFVGGLGANYAWENDGRCEEEANKPFTNLHYADNDNRWAFNGRLGLILDIPVHRNISVNIEGDYNHIVSGHNNRFNTDKHQITAQVGVNFKFGKRAPKTEVPAAVVTPAEKAPVEEWATRIDTIWYDEPTEKTRIENGQAKWEVFYEIRESDMEGADAKIRAIGRFLKDYRDCKISVKSYADRGTGNPRVNLEYSKQRSEKAVKALVESGVSESLITAEYFGDTVQPYADNDKNRVTIIVATGLKDIKDKSSVKKFRTKEVRYRVK